VRLARLIVAAALLASGCATEKPEPPLLPSPLVEFDKDRLWVLAKAARFGDGKSCGDFYLGEVAEGTSRHFELEGQCDEWAAMFAEYLRANGLPTAEAAHLQGEWYWTWFDGMRTAIAACKRQHSPPDRGGSWSEYRYNKNACDPFVHATKNAGKLSIDLGITFTGRVSHGQYEDVPLDRMAEYRRVRLGEKE